MTPEKPIPLDKPQIQADTQHWLEKAVIGLNLCPFAKSVHVNQRLRYVVTSETGPDHDKHFVVAVRFNSDKVARGEGRSKKMAEQHAAREALKLLGVIKEK